MRHQRRSIVKLEALRQLCLFARSTATDLDGLLNNTDVVMLPVATVIDRNRTAARQFIGIVEGYVRGLGTNGRPFVLGPGDHIGADELLNHQPHSATYTTTTATVLVAVFGPAFTAAARSIPGIAGSVPLQRTDDVDHPVSVAG